MARWPSFFRCERYTEIEIPFPALAELRLDFQYLCLGEDGLIVCYQQFLHTLPSTDELAIQSLDCQPTSAWDTEVGVSVLILRRRSL